MNNDLSEFMRKRNSNINKGTGIKPGTWFFEDFVFCQVRDIRGQATVKYVCDARKLRPWEMDEHDTGKPYELMISEPEVTDVKVFNDDGDELDLTTEAHAKDVPELKALVLAAFKEIEDFEVIEFEMGLL